MSVDKKRFSLYAVTDRRDACVSDFLHAVEQALQGGVTMLQLREKSLPTHAFLQLAEAVKARCDAYAVPLIINDRVDIALAVGAAGVHVGITDMPVSRIRRQVGDHFLIGATAKTIPQALDAVRDGADYLGVGAVFPSPTKPNAVRITPDTLRAIRAAVSVPIVAIGGITADNLYTLHGCGIDGVAVSSALFGARDIASSAAALQQKISEVIV